MRKTSTAWLGLAMAAGLVSAPLVSLAETAGAEGVQVLRAEDSPYRLRASDLLGMDVINRDGDEIGEIDDLTVNDNGELQAILALGGFLGMGEKMVTLGYDDMSFDGEREHLVVNLTEDEIENMDDFAYNEGELLGRDITPGNYQVE